MEKDRSIGAHISKRIWQMALHGCLLVTVAFLFSFKIYPSDFHLSKKGKTHTDLRAYSHVANSIFQNPVGHKEVRIFIDNIVEPEEDDIQLDGFYWNSESVSSAAEGYNLLSDKKLSALPHQFFTKHGSVPLFVFYHSWKNFIH